jgi:hypothetical protein
MCILYRMDYFTRMDRTWYMSINPKTQQAEFYNPTRALTVSRRQLPRNAIVKRSAPTLQSQLVSPVVVDPSRPVLRPKTQEQTEKNKEHTRSLISMGNAINQKRKVHNAMREKVMKYMNQQDIENGIMKGREEYNEMALNVQNRHKEEKRTPEMKRQLQQAHLMRVNRSKQLNRNTVKGGCGWGFGGKRGGKRSTKRSTRR